MREAYAIYTRMRRVMLLRQTTSDKNINTAGMCIRGNIKNNLTKYSSVISELLQKVGYFVAMCLCEEYLMYEIYERRIS